MKKLIITLFIILFSCNATINAQSKFELEAMLDEWAEEEFGSCYSGRTYKSITLSNFYLDRDNNKIEMEGYVSYLNLLDISVRWKFKATLKLYSQYRAKMIFRKYDGFSEDWEICERTIGN
ncbi:hypothetical protein GO491_07215 [Flavobacteriaceae bacterium Ap0902]|nr:hypothetical protein [Flavobacteriaceae bacterium Ap0902]